MPRLVILEIIFRDETLAAMLAMVSKVAFMHPPYVGSQRNSIPRDQATQLASIRDASVNLHMIVHLRHALEAFLANRALVRTFVAVLHHMLFISPVQSESHMAYGTFVSRTLTSLFFSVFDIN